MSSVKAVRLRTDALENPLGLDHAAPLFRWELESDADGVRQAACQVVVSADPDFLDPVWDSGTKTDSETSLRYRGPAFDPCTVYYWKVAGITNSGRSFTSETASFETGLGGTGSSLWNGAQWIGSPNRSINADACTCYRLETEVRLAEGNGIGIVLAARDRDNFVEFCICPSRRNLLLREFSDNSRAGRFEDGNFPSVVTLGSPDGYEIPPDALPADSENRWMTVRITVNGREVSVSINGHTVLLRVPDLMPSAGTFVPRKSALMKIGFRQPNSEIEVRRIAISLPDRDFTLLDETFSRSAGILRSLGTVRDGVLTVRHAFSIVNPAPSGMLLTGFIIRKPVKSARIYAAARGFYNLSLNSRPVCVIENTLSGRELSGIQKAGSSDSAAVSAAAGIPSAGHPSADHLSDDGLSAAGGFPSAESPDIADESPADDNRVYFVPGFTDYRRRIQYQTYDVTGLVRAGVNRLLAELGKGYFSGFVGYSGPCVYGEQNSFLCRLALTYADGSSDELVSGPGWYYTDLCPVTDSDVLDGETYDARLIPDGWDSEKYDDDRWVPCGTYPWPEDPVPSNGVFEKRETFRLSAQEEPYARAYRVLKPVSRREFPYGHFVFDFGQNLTGIIRLRVRGPRGLSLRIRYGEMCYRDGQVYTENLRSAYCTDLFTLAGTGGTEEFVPLFTFHGFRYAEITGNGTLLTDGSFLESIEAIAITNTPEATGTFECSDPGVSRLQSNIQWSQRGNSLLVFTDCPQRNERMGWTGDAQVFAPTAVFNMDLEAFARKWMQDIRDGQLMYNRRGAIPDTCPMGGDNRPRPCSMWADACVLFPWEIYKAYGDERILLENYDCMKRWVDYEAFPENRWDGVRTAAEAEAAAAGGPGRGGDGSGSPGSRIPGTSSVGARPADDEAPDTRIPGTSSEPWLQVPQTRSDHLSFDPSTPSVLCATAYAARSALLLSKTAEILGKTEDAEKYAERFEQIRRAFREAFVGEDGSIRYIGDATYNGKNPDGTDVCGTLYAEHGSPYRPSQTAYALAVDFGLMPEETMDRTARYFARTVSDRGGKLTCGFLGISHLLPALTKAGLTETAWSLLLQKDCPGWLYSVRNGATTIWERWNSYNAETGEFGDVSMNSFNHYAYGSVGQWLYQTAAGISGSGRKGEAGYRRIFLAPHIGGIDSVSAAMHTVHGTVKSSWSVSRDSGEVSLRFTVPCSTTARFFIPENLEDVALKDGYARGVLRVKGQNGVFDLQPGAYHFTGRLREAVSSERTSDGSQQ
ncbi:MAG: family 78 glycoside hydrolase catalytic domain [Lachnospiraceae bacterium]|jgi:alpha-L-rhamnosidase